MNYGWLKLTQFNDLAVFVWIVDAEMISEEDHGSTVYLHHDKIRVKETPEWIIEKIEQINNRAEAEEAAKNMPAPLQSHAVAGVGCLG